MLLKNQWVNNEIKKEIRKYLEKNKNENTTLQNLWDAARTVLTVKFTVIQTFLKHRRKISNKQPNPAPKRIKKRRKNPKSAVGRK